MKPRVFYLDVPMLNARLIEFIDKEFPVVTSPKGGTFGNMDALYGVETAFTLLGDIVLDYVKEVHKRDGDIRLMWFTKCKDNIRVSPHVHTGDGDVSFCYYPFVPDGAPGLGLSGGSEVGSEVYQVPIETGSLILFSCDDVHWVNPAKFTGHRYCIPGTVAFKG